MSGATLAPARRSGTPIRMDQGDLICVSGADDVHDILERMTYFRIPRVLVSGPQGPFSIVELEDLLPCEADLTPRQMGDLIRDAYFGG